MRLDAYFLATSTGAAFCTVCGPKSPAVAKFAVLALMPFADENNKCRRMVMLQARAWSEIGGVTLVIDLSGTGDSLAEFRDATWDAWLSEAEVALEHLRSRYCAEVWLWGIRTGALVVVQLADRIEQKPAGMLFWQPVLSGKSYLSQFFRLSVASRMLGPSDSIGDRVLPPRELIARGSHAEVGGYEIGPALAGPMEQCAMENFRPSVRLLWLECGPTGELSAASTRLISSWRDIGARIESAAVVGPSFWASQEIETSEALVHKTTALMAGAITENPVR